MSIFSLNAASLMNAIQNGGIMSVLSTTLYPEYAIRVSGGNEFLPVSGVAVIEPGGTATITNAPVEKGKYQSINKVRDPGRIRYDVVVNGFTGFSGDIPNLFDFTLTTQNETIQTIRDMISTAQTYDIDTPKGTFESYDLIGWRCRTSAESGVTMLIVSLDFQEVQQVMSVTLSTSQSESKATDNKLASGDTGVSSEVNKPAGQALSSVDKMKAELRGLNDSIGEITDKITSSVSKGLDTLTDSAADVIGGAAKKANELTAEIGAKVL